MAQLFVKDPWDCSFTYIVQLNKSGKGSEKNSLCILLKPVHLIYLDTYSWVHCVESPVDY